MNVIVSNRQKEIIDNANIDAIKDLNGLFNVSDLINKFKNYFFSKMILDATSVVDFASREVLTTLAEEIGAEKLIILLPSTPEPPVEFKKLLIELKIYNFTNNIEDVIKFIENPNTYEDAMKMVDTSYGEDNMYVDNSIKEEAETKEEEEKPDSDSFENTNVDNTNNFNSNNTSFENTNNNQNIEERPNNMGQNNNDGYYHENKASFGDILNSFSLKTAASNNATFENNSYNNEPRMDTNVQYNNSNERENVNNSNDNNSFESGGHNTFLISDGFDNNYSSTPEPHKIVIGIKNITSHAGSTSLIYMLHKTIVNSLKKEVLSIEIDKNDFRLFRNNKMISVPANEVKNVIDNAHEEIILVDVNAFEQMDLFDDVLYLVEPSTIKLNELMATNKTIFRDLKNKKVILNKSMLNSNDVNTLASEAGLEFFGGIGPLNDRIFNDVLINLLSKMNIK